MPKTHSQINSNNAQNLRSVELMMRAKCGDQAAFCELVKIHQNAVIGTVAKILGNASEAEDIAQQVFLRLWKSAPRYEVKAKFTTFLFTIVRNLVFNETRRKQRRKEHSLEEQEQNSFTEIADQHSQLPDEEILKVELRAQVDSAINALPEKQRMAVILRRYEDMPYEQIAEVLEISVPAVKSQLFRARTALRELLSDYLSN